MRLAKRLGLLVAAAFLVNSPNTHANPPAINILTGGTSGVYYPLGMSLSELYRENIKGSTTSVRATKASVENLNLLQIARGQLAFALGDSVADAWKGDEEAGFRAPRDRLRAIAGIYPNYIQIVASQASGIRSLEDLRGKRISVGAPRSGTELNARAIFKAAGLSYKDMGQVEFKPYADSVELIEKGQLDATLQSAGLGMAAIRELAERMPITFVAIPEQVVSRVGGAYQPGIIPAGTYKGQASDVATATITNLLVSQTSVADDVAYQMARLLFENLDRLAEAHPAAKDIQLQRATNGLPIPLHPGAERFYREVGVLE
ncbi:TAXI family TRAP transporter solute-binding subunit [Ectopseudomonas mendocina]|uniref:TAXI family TRAP transporter solute-binding subunit n=1 Tax=Ectopseudomonas mendocina TaxID=300 RepID=A0ABD7RVC5_ECTME|nr:TAXI family TRAP transporter solute-binding subunit [Pseudomonas mendocina]TRO11541.1 TAXI family TRAP transporter solute-binding subunit [Pseudomonas mendocina]TRO16613.1 TAXI family TRAP transporter solute-binding subunit [Pseudomonas mendocina]